MGIESMRSEVQSFVAASIDQTFVGKKLKFYTVFVSLEMARRMKH